MLQTTYKSNSNVFIYFLGSIITRGCGATCNTNKIKNVTSCTICKVNLCNGSGRNGIKLSSQTIIGSALVLFYFCFSIVG